MTGSGITCSDASGKTTCSVSGGLASDVTTDTTEFDNNLSTTDDTVQQALETLDEMSNGLVVGGTGERITGSTYGSYVDFDDSGAAGITVNEDLTLGDGSSTASITFDNDGGTDMTIAADEVGDYLETSPIVLGGDTGVKLSAASGVLTLAGIGNTNNENLIIDLESSLNRIKLSSGSSALLTLADSMVFYYGTDSDIGMVWTTTGNDNFQLATVLGSATGSGYINIVERADLGSANRSPLATSANPVLRIYSSNAGNPLDYGEQYFDSDYNLKNGSGNINLISTGNIAMTGNTVTVNIVSTGLTVSTGFNPTSSGRAVCWNGNRLGYCSSQPDASGNCTCN